MKMQVRLLVELNHIFGMNSRATQVTLCGMSLPLLQQSVNWIFWPIIKNPELARRSQ